jgi:hypothetical protein
LLPASKGAEKPVFRQLSNSPGTAPKRKRLKGDKLQFIKLIGVYETRSDFVLQLPEPLRLLA